MRVTLWPTCLGRQLFPGAGAAARRVLTRLGCEVDEPRAAVCCGQPAYNSGHTADAYRVAAGTLPALEDDGPLVLCSGSCTTMLARHWDDLFSGSELAGRAAAVSARARDFASFVVRDLGAEPRGMLEPCVAVYHDSCHMLRSLKERDEPRRLLASIEGLELRELTAPERCCGFGGTFSLRYPELSSAMADEKVDDALERGAEFFCASDLGCLMQIAGRAGERGVGLPGRYIAEVVDQAQASGERGADDG